MRYVFIRTKSIRRTWPLCEYLACDKYQFIYCPIAKVACSSIKKWLLSLHGMQSQGHVLHEVAQKHFSLRTHENPKRALNRYYTFGFVRNPWSRLVSAYVNKFVTPEPLELHSAIAITECLRADPDEGISFAQFVNYLASTDVKKEDEHWRPQYLFLPKKLDLLGRFEQLKLDFQTVQRKLGIETSLLHENKTGVGVEYHGNCAHLTPRELRAMPALPPLENFYTTELLDIVGRIFGEDIERFGYQPLKVMGSESVSKAGA